MNHERLAHLYELLNQEYKKEPVDHKRIAEVNHYISKEFADAKPEAGSWWDWIPNLPDNWKQIASAVIAAGLALNSQFHWVTQDVQNALIAVAVSLGFWVVSNQQVTLKRQLNKFIPQK